MAKKIIAVDDDEQILDEIESIFEEIEGDYDIITSLSGEETIKIIKEERPDLVITAIDIDEIDGLDIIKEAKKLNIATIVLSSRIDEETVGMIISYYKPDFYIKKPIDRLKFIKSVKHIFKNKEDHIEGIPSDKIEAVLKGICDSIKEGIAIIDKNLNVVWINKALEKKGFEFQKVIGKKSYKVFENKEFPESDSPTLKTFQDGKINKIEKKGLDGFNYRITAIPIKDEKKKIIYVIEFGETI